MTLNEMQLKIKEQEAYIQSLNEIVELLLTYLGLRLGITPEHEIKLEEKGMEN
jgi:hypothetical protein